MHIGIGTKKVHFHYNLLTFDITFVFYDGIAIDHRCSWREDVSTTLIRGDVRGCDVTRRRSHRLKEDQDQRSWTLWKSNDILNDAKDVVTSKVDKVDILNIWKDSQIADLYFCVPETKRERVAHWLSVFNIVIFYFDKLWYDSLNSL